MMCDTNRLWLQVSWTFILSLGLVAARAAAQDKPADTKKAPAAAPAVAAPAAPGAEGKKSEAAKEAKTDAPAETDPFVLAILGVKPTTPEQWLQDIRALIQLNRPQLAKEYLKQFSESLPAADELARLQARFGSALFLQLSSLESLQPEGALVGNAVMQAADARIGNVQRLKGLVDRLDDENAAAKRLAMADLVQAGPLAVPVLIQVLADPTQAGVHPAAIRTLQAIGSGSVDPLIATLETTDDRLKAVAIRVLGSLKAAQGNSLS